MLCEIVHESGSDVVKVPSVFKEPKPDQMRGTAAERLIEVAGRSCYSSLGSPTSRDSVAFHRNLAGIDGTAPHFSVHEHFHFTVETALSPMPWLGIPDVSVRCLPGDKYRVTANLRHAFEWPRNVTYAAGPATAALVESWEKVLRPILYEKMPSLFHNPYPLEATPSPYAELVAPETDCEAFVSLFLEDSLVWCYAPDTEIFTDKGWVSVADVTLADKLLTRNKAGISRWAHPTVVNSFDYKGKLFWWEHNQMVSPAMTPDHTLLVANPDLRRARNLSNGENMDKHGERVKLKDAWGKRFVICTSITLDNPDIDMVEIGGVEYDAVDLYSWLGWLSTDGTMSKSNLSRCTIFQSKLANIPRIRQLMQRLFGEKARENGPYDDTGTLQWDINNRQLAEWARKMIGPNKKERDLSPAFFELPRPVLLAFYKAALRGDGSVHWKNGHESLYCPSLKAAGQWQAIISCLGRSANVITEDRTGESRIYKGSVFRSTQPGYTVSVCRKTALLVKNQMKREIDYDGKVYCPTTEDGLVFVRRKGTAFWCGNSLEQNRHRFNISQRSGRFCDQTDRADCMHPMLAEYLADVGDAGDAPNNAETFYKNQDYKDKLVRAIVNQQRLQRDNYLHVVGALQAWLTAKGTVDKLTARKQARSAGRYYLGQSLSTEGCYTASIRNWRTIFKQRCNPAADAAIRAIMDKAQETVRASRWGHLL